MASETKEGGPTVGLAAPAPGAQSAPHTPGPWTTAATDDSLVLKGRLKIASVYPIGMDQPQEEANARLIAAAPDLLSALIELRDAVKASKTMEGREYVSLGIAVNNAVAKATGQ